MPDPTKPADPRMVRTADALLSVTEAVIARDWLDPARTVETLLADAGLSMEPRDAGRGVCQTRQGLQGRYRHRGNRLGSVGFRFTDPHPECMEQLGDVIHDWFVGSFGPSMDSATRHHSQVRAHRWVHSCGLTTTLEVTPAPDPLVWCQISRDVAVANQLAAERAFHRAARLLAPQWPQLASHLPGAGLTLDGDQLTACTAPGVDGRWTGPSTELYLRYNHLPPDNLDELTESLTRLLSTTFGPAFDDQIDTDRTREITWETDAATVGLVRSPSLELVAMYLDSAQ